MRIDVSPKTGIEVAKRMIFLAWKASSCLGMGIFQDRGPRQSEEEVWAQAYDKKDYPGGRALSGVEEGACHADYVFGRMMKLYLKFGDHWIDVSNSAPRSDYQSWCGNYPTYETLAQAAIESFST